MSAKPGAQHTFVSTVPKVPAKAPTGTGKCILLAIVFGVMVIVLALVMRGQIGAVGKKADAAKTSSDMALSAVTKQRDDMSGLIQSVGQALNTLKANGSLSPEQVAAIAAAVATNQAAKGGAKAQAGTTPGIPGSRSGGGTSVMPGVAGSATTKPIASQTMPLPSSSSTAKCLATVDIATILKLDGTVCPP